MDEELEVLRSDRRLADADKTETDLVDEDRQPEDREERGIWGHKAEFLLAIVGYTVGFGSVWRFPILCARNGGGAFLIPFFFFLITSGGPLYYLEVCLGQFTGKSAGLAFEYCPLFKGLGYLQLTISALCLWYGMMVLSWTFYFLYSSFFPVLPWTTCNNEWNTPQCRADHLPPVEGISGGSNTTGTTNLTSDLSSFDDVYNTTVTMVSSNETENNFSSAFEFWQHRVVGRSAGLEDMGHLQGHLVICLFLAWLCVVLGVIKGVRTLGKVVYVTATLPYILLTVILIRGVTLDGSLDGILFYVTPDFSRLTEIQVWVEAAIQVFYSLGPSWGGVITMASYNKFHEKSFWPTAICVTSSGFTSFYNGLVVFSIIGFMAKESGSTTQALASASGPGLAFVAFPTALSRLPLPQLWSVLFFVTLITIIFDSEFGMLETVTGGIIDFFPHKLTGHRILINILTGLFFFLAGLPYTMNGGVYLVQLADWYFSMFALLFCSWLETVSLCWVYGTDRFSRDIAYMTGRSVSVVLRVFWTILNPVVAFAMFVVVLARYSPPAYGDGYVYGDYAIAAGITCGLLPVAAALAAACWAVCKTRGSLKQKCATLLRPSNNWYPNDSDTRLQYRLHPYQYQESFVQRLLANITGTKKTPCF